MKLAIQLSDAQEKRLAEIAARLNVPARVPSGGGRSGVGEPIGGNFDQVATRLLEKNREPYERLR